MENILQVDNIISVSVQFVQAALNVHLQAAMHVHVHFKKMCINVKCSPPTGYQTWFNYVQPHKIDPGVDHALLMFVRPNKHFWLSYSTVDPFKCWMQVASNIYPKLR